MPDITVYSQPGCFPCRGVKRYLDSRNIEYRAVDITEDADALAQLRELGYQQTPVVVYGTEHHSGFQPSRLDAIIASLPA